jgi:class 3 adenylate cyclase
VLDRGGVFAGIRDDRHLIEQVRAKPDSRTIEWPGEVDRDPDVLHGTPEPASGIRITRRVCTRRAGHTMRYVMEVLTRYARSAGLQIAYQVVGEGHLDIVLVPRWFSNIELDWEMPPHARFVGQLASFARVIQFDRRGAGMSGGVAGATPLEDQIDDVRAVLEAAASEQPVLVSIAEGCALAVLYAATHPDLVRALVLITPTPRTVQGPGYEWAQTMEERAAWVRAVVEHWASASQEQPWGAFAGQDEQRRRLLARSRRLSMTPDAAAASLAMVGKLDVRDALLSVQCPSLVLHRANEKFVDKRHSRFAAEHIPNAQYVETQPGSHAADEIAQFLTGVRRPVVSDRVLATVLFTDIVGSTERAAELGDGGWRELLERHDALAQEQVERHRGRFIKSLGDGILATFDGPSRAISCAIAIRDGVRNLNLTVRAGLHTGECELRADDDIGGLAVHIGARISSLAIPGEVLVSSTVRDLIVGSDQLLTHRGEHELKGVPGRWHVFAVQTHTPATAA